VIAQVGQRLLLDYSKLNRVLSDTRVASKFKGVVGLVVPTHSYFRVTVQMIDQSGNITSRTADVASNVNNDQGLRWVTRFTDQSSRETLPSAEPLDIAVGSVVNSQPNLICVSVSVKPNPDVSPAIPCHILLTSFYNQTLMLDCAGLESGSNRQCYDTQGVSNIQFRRKVYTVLKRMVERIAQERQNTPIYPEFVNICAPLLCRPDAGDCFGFNPLMKEDVNTSASLSPLDAIPIPDQPSLLFVHTDLDDPENPDADKSQRVFTSKGMIQWRYNDVRRWIADIQKLSILPSGERTSAVDDMLRHIRRQVIGVRTLWYYLKKEVADIQSGKANDLVILKGRVVKSIRRQQDGMSLNKQTLGALQNGVEDQISVQNVLHYIQTTQVPGNTLTFGQLFTKDDTIQNNNLNELMRLVNVLLRAQTDIPIANLDFLDTVAKLGGGHAMCMFNTDTQVDDPASGIPETLYQLKESTFDKISNSIRTLFGVTGGRIQQRDVVMGS
jgi:hypothetical protein